MVSRESSRLAATIGSAHIAVNRNEALTLIDWSQIDECDQKPWRSLPLRSVWCRRFHPLYRRFLCACCRELKLTDDVVRHSLELIEGFAYGNATFDELVAARKALRSAARRLARSEPVGSGVRMAAKAVHDAARNDAQEALSLCVLHFRQAGLSIRRQAEIFERTAAEWVAEASGPVNSGR